MMRAIVVGTGAGGATAARQLATTFDVTVLEAGSGFKRFQGDLGRVERLRSSRLLIDPRMIQLLFPPMHVSMASDHMALMYGIATGGTTTLATGNALRCDEPLLTRGIDLGPDFDALAAELPISTRHQSRWRPVTRELFSTCQTLGLNPTLTPKLVDYEKCTRCGRCVLGCPTSAKWDSRKYLRQAVARGARLLTSTTVERVVVDGAGNGHRATGVVVRQQRRRELLPADLVVLAAGGVGTPAILRRSGIRTDDRLFVDPVLCVAAPAEGSRADEEVPMPFVVEGDGYIISPYFDYLSFFFNRAWRRPRHDIAALMIKLADSEVGSVDRRQRVSKSLSARDKLRLAVATESCVEILARFGARRQSLFLGTLNAGHPGGTVPLSGRERHPFHADHLPENLYVADASLLPQSLGKPPILTIMALARRVAAICQERFA
jgi:choline dehydrogenase-like flavoprotein